MTSIADSAETARADNLRGALWMLASVAGATGMTLTVRELSADLHTGMIAFLRSVFGLVILAPLLARPPARRWPSRPWLHLWRAGLIAAALNFGYHAISRLPLATAVTLLFLAPVFTTLLAPAITGERVGATRRAAVVAGFAGALVILRPGAAPVDPAMLAAVASSLCFALALLIGRLASDADGPDAVFVSTTALAPLLTLPPALPVWGTPAGLGWAALAGLVAFSTLRGYADVRAFAVGDAAFVAPFSYLRLLTVGAAGWLLFGEVPDGWTLAGAAAIVAATLAIALRSGRRRSLGGPE